MAHYRPDIAVRYKDDRSPVTDADQAAEAIILEELSRLLPGVPVIAEEEAAAGRIPRVGAQFFLVDPLDGTKDFLRRTGEFTVNIALVVERIARLGLVYAPALERCYLTLEASRAVRFALPPSPEGASDAEYEFEPLPGLPLPGRPFTAFISRSHANPEVHALLKEMRVESTITMGSSLKFCALAAGEADVYPRLGETSEWDTAAGHAILAAAGGVVLTLDGAPLLYGKSDRGFLNPPFIAWRRPPDPRS
jgi:3'(2'), 5'-bisphosphate nucleotidase